MELVSFSVSKYRSIVKASKVPIHRSTILIGANNEGKSNILQALVATLEILRRLGQYRMLRGGRLNTGTRFLGSYVWDRDFPVSLQEKTPDGETVFKLELKLSDDENTEFEHKIKSKLNGTLPLEITLGTDKLTFKILKRGPGGPALSKKIEPIAHFISGKINLSYIPAVRTAESATDVVGELLEKELAEIENNEEYQNALQAVADLQKPILDKISGSIKETLQEFLPNVQEVTVSIPEDERYRRLRRGCTIVVDDGAPTTLERKGDGVQSLAALSLMRHASESRGAGRNLILAIEEPESHLHPKAIHQLRNVISEIADKHQVIMTTHCPLFVDRTTIKSNIIVDNNRAVPAKDIKQIREILGVRAADNLQNAELVLIVEGEEDRRAMYSLLPHYSPIISSAIKQRSLAIESLQGGTNLSYKLSQIRESMCTSHTLLDDDECGKKSCKKAELDGLLIIADVTFTLCDGQKEAEIEDMYDVNLYSNMLQNKYGISTNQAKFKNGDKWSDRLKLTFKVSAKHWSNEIEAKVKSDVAELVEANPGTALNVHKRNSFDALVQALEYKLTNIANSKK